MNIVIEQVRLINWRSHADTLLQFKEGTNLIIGIMGSGKSSVMDGISFGLFGTFPSLESRRLKISDLFRQDSEELEVLMELEWEGKKYRIIRKIRKKNGKHSSEAEIYVDSKLIEKGNKAVSQYIEQVLGIDYDLFARAIYSEQNSIDYFLSLNPKRRKEEFDSLLGLDRFEKVRANVTTLANRYKNKKKDLDSEFSKNKLNEFRESFEKKGEEKEKLEKMEKGKTTEMENLKPKIIELKDKFSELRKKEEKKRKLSEEEIGVKTRIKSYEEQLKGKRIDEKEEKELNMEVGELKKTYEELLRKIRKENGEINIKNKKLGEMEVELNRKNRLEKDVEKLGEVPSGTIEKYEKNVEKLGKEILNGGVEERKTTEEIEEIEDVLKKMKKGRENCPFCGTGMDKEKIEKISEKKNEEKEKLNDQLRKMKKKNLEYNKELKKLKVETEKLKENESQRKKIENEISKINVNRKDVEKIKMEMEKEIKEVRGKEEERVKVEKNTTDINSKILEIKKLIELKNKIKEYEKTLPKISKEIEKLKFDEKELRKTETEIAEIRIIFEKLKSEIISSRKELKYLEEIINSLRKNIENLEKLDKKIKKIGKMEEELIVYKNILKEVQVSLRDELIESINIAMNEIWRIFYPYGDYKKLRVKVTEKDYDFEIYNNEWKSLESTVSGGERACAALTLRVALSTVLTPNISWLILDEPTHNLDRETVRLLSETLQTRVPEIIKQTIVITHEELLLGANFSRSYKLKRDKTIGEATQVEQL